MGIANIDRRVDVGMIAIAAAGTVEAGLVAIAFVDMSTLAASLAGIARVYENNALA